MPVSILVDIPDLAEVRRDLEAVRLGLGRTLDRTRREAAELALPEVQARTPFGPGPIPGAQNPNDLLPHIRDTLRAGTATITSNHPAALVTEYGGTIAPHGGDIVIAAAQMAKEGGAAAQPEIERLLDRELNQLLDRNGL